MSFRRSAIGFSLALASLCVPALVAAQELAQVAPQQLRRVDPPSPSMSAKELEARGEELCGQKYYADAMDYFSAAIEKHDSAQLRNKMGIAQLQMMRFSESKKSFEKAIKLNKAYPEAYNNLGVVFYMSKNNGKAIKYYERAIKIQPLSASFHSNLGTVLFDRKEFNKAAQEYARAMQLDPLIFERQSRNGVSIKSMNPADRAQYAYTIAKLYLHTGDVTHCLLYLRKAQEEGIVLSKKLDSDPAFSQYRKDPRFMAVMNHQPMELPDPQ